MATTSVTLDHLAVAVEQRSDAWPMYRDQLGGRWADIAGLSKGFAFAQLGYAGGLKIEVLSPHEWEQNDFLRRFLDHTGPGPHHMTFKVPDLDVMLKRCEEMGYRTVGVFRENLSWQEAFLHPKDGAGVVIQLAQLGEDDDDEDEDEFVPADWTGDPTGPQARMLFVAHAVSEFESHLRRFVTLLEGVIDDRGSDESLDAEWVDVVWSNSARLRLLKPRTTQSPLVAWLEDRPGRIHHVAYAGVPGMTGEIAPDENLGLRLIFT
jgi:Glyoxalase/Bleomycin resistance protein/Dioxygenase superfamily